MEYCSAENDAKCRKMTQYSDTDPAFGLALDQALAECRLALAFAPSVSYLRALCVKRVVSNTKATERRHKGHKGVVLLRPLGPPKRRKRVTKTFSLFHFFTLSHLHTFTLSLFTRPTGGDITRNEHEDHRTLKTNVAANEAATL